MIAHITTRQAWKDARSTGIYEADSLQTDGFIHCSAISAEQLLAVADHAYAGQTGLVLQLVEPEVPNSEVRYEKDEASGQSFPHVYGPIHFGAVVNVLDFPPQPDGTFRLPDPATLAPSGS